MSFTNKFYLISTSFIILENKLEILASELNQSAKQEPDLSLGFFCDLSTKLDVGWKTNCIHPNAEA